MNKKGELTDMLIWIITIFILAVGLFTLMYITPQIFGGLNVAGLNNSVAGAKAISDSNTMISGTINNGFLMLFIGLIISLMITSFMVRTHPVFLFLYVLFLGLTILISFYLGNAYQQMITNPTFSAMYTTATFANFVMGNIAEITIAVGALSMIILFAKFSSFGGTQQF